MKKLLLILGLATLPALAQAQDAIYLSGLLGVGTLNEVGVDDNYDSNLTYGIRGGLLFNDHVSAGLYLQHLVTEDGAGPETTSTNIMAEVTFYLNPADEHGLWVSGLLGTTQVAVDAVGNIPSISETSMAFGASLGYHFMVAPNFSLSPQVTYVYVDDINEISFSQLSGIINLSFWL